MELQGRELKLNMRGDDVKLLQEELSKLGFSIEDQEGFYGRTTRKAVLEFQSKYGLEATGVVDATTAARINAEVDASRPESFIVRGKPTSRTRAGASGLIGGVGGFIGTHW